MIKPISPTMQIANFNFGMHFPPIRRNFPKNQDTNTDIFTGGGPYDKISFGYKSILKTAWLKGLLPSVKIDIYGDKLITPSIEHNIPKSHKFGKSDLKNYSLANTWTNNARGAKNLLDFTTEENIKNWYKQFVDVKIPDFDGNDYIRKGLNNLKKIGIKIDPEEVIDAGRNKKLDFKA